MTRLFFSETTSKKQIYEVGRHHQPLVLNCSELSRHINAPGALIFVGLFKRGYFIKRNEVDEEVSRML